jgi:hypothetical protein
MKRLAKRVLAVAALLVLAAPLADARGGGGRGGFGGGGMGGRRGGGGKDARSSAQANLLISDCVRDDNVRRMRHVDW